MQNQYVGDIGDYIKFALLRALCEHSKLGIAWYLFPDEPHKGDGRHTSYLDNSSKWEKFDPALFQVLAKIVKRKKRDIRYLEAEELFKNVRYSSELLSCHEGAYQARFKWREGWFERVFHDLKGCDVIFADPDNGPKLDERFRCGTRLHWKSIPLNEMLALAANRTAIIYFHNTRAKGGHAQENYEWLRHLPPGSFAVYCRATSCRTFLVINPTNQMRKNAALFAEKWGRHVDLIEIERP